MRFELSSKDVEMYSEGKRILGSTDSKQLNQQVRTRPNLSLELISLLKRVDMLNVQHMFGTWVWNGLNIGYPKIQNFETYSFLEMAIYVGGELSLWPVNIHQITIHIPMKYPIPMAYGHHRCGWYLPPARKLRLRLHCFAQACARMATEAKLTSWSISLGGKPHVEQSIVTICNNYHHTN